MVFFIIFFGNGANFWNLLLESSLSLDREFIVGNFDIVNGEYNISLALTEEATADPVFTEQNTEEMLLNEGSTTVEPEGFFSKIFRF